MGTLGSAADSDRYLAVHESAQFKDLQRRSNSYTIWASAVLAGWWLLFLFLAAFVPDFFREDIVGPVNVGLLFLFLTLNLVVTIAVRYLRFARTRLDPLSDRIRAELEGDLR